MADRINFSQNINVSLQTGDTLNYLDTYNGLQLTTGDPIEIGVITDIGDKFVEVASNTVPVNLDLNATIFMFKKRAFNNAGVKGYFAEARLSTTSIDKVELFSIGSEITQSSK